MWGRAGWRRIEEFVMRLRLMVLGVVMKKYWFLIFILFIVSCDNSQRNNLNSQRNNLSAIIKGNWKGDELHGWVNLKTNIVVRVSADHKILTAWKVDGKIVWVAQTDDANNGTKSDDPGYKYMHPGKITDLLFERETIHYWMGKCWGSVDAKTGKVTFEGCD